jgi:hypothetical protein
MYRSVKYIVLLGIVALIQFGCSKEEIADQAFGPFDDTSEMHDVVIIEDIINDIPIIVVGHAIENMSQLDDQNEHNPVNVRPEFVFVVAFSREVNGKVLEFNSIQDQFPIVLKD